jgi:hypothetical protein
VPGAAGLDCHALAGEFQLSGGHIRNIALRAASLAAAEERPIGLELLRRAARLEMEDMGRITPSSHVARLLFVAPRRAEPE